MQISHISAKYQQRRYHCHQNGSGCIESARHRSLHQRMIQRLLRLFGRWPVCECVVRFPNIVLKWDGETPPHPDHKVGLTACIVPHHPFKRLGWSGQRYTVCNWRNVRQISFRVSRFGGNRIRGMRFDVVLSLLPAFYGGRVSDKSQRHKIYGVLQSGGGAWPSRLVILRLHHPLQQNTKTIHRVLTVPGWRFTRRNSILPRRKLNMG